MTATAPPPLSPPLQLDTVSTAVISEDVATLDTGYQPGPGPGQPLLAELWSHASCLGVATGETGEATFVSGLQLASHL